MTPEQVRENVLASEMAPLMESELACIRDIYQRHTFYDPGIKTAATQAELSQMAKAA
jgi:hypothetical protein